ncbi:PerC family transcriptional regulator [Escherichia coli]|uniref:Transcriptional activator n=1 Tax=Escherichia coli TaxID=562 RepID=A0A376VSU5_ECOLX|nr:PerC family transcriptional regulator [Escherichia coli]EEX1945543.1 PerC family transcriptional regulator [Escherichia coli]EFE9925370.1 PerC family transcriptional regulator [Escherichia coli]EFI7814620.1 PerC family transcriptional regulator [Escherichia coli]EFK2536803.1 PerC family transcriptional regulator [Escherichia coli]EFO4249100.1 PerC family transcriptional regulator [Escherichia coli]
MIADSVAQKLEERGLWRRAATRWGDVLLNAETDKEREEAAERRARCIRKSRLPPEPVETFGGLSKAATRTLNDMGIDLRKEDPLRGIPAGISRKKKQGG